MFASYFAIICYFFPVVPSQTSLYRNLYNPLIQQDVWLMLNERLGQRQVFWSPGAKAVTVRPLSSHGVFQSVSVCLTLFLSVSVSVSVSLSVCLSVSLSIYIFSMGICKELAYVITEAQSHSLLSVSWRPRKAALWCHPSPKA